MKNPIPYKSSVSIVKLDSYSIRRMDLGGLTVGTEIMIRPKIINVYTHRADVSIRRCTATFVYTVTGGDGTEKPLPLRTRSRDRDLVFRFDISNLIVNPQAIALTTLNVLAGYLATGMVRSSSVPPRDALYITYMDGNHRNTTLWDIWHSETLSCESWESDLVVTNEVTHFQSNRVRKEIPYVYKPSLWPIESAREFCTSQLNGAFVLLSPNPPQ